MLRLSRKELLHRRAAKLIQTTEEMFRTLGFDDLVEPGVKVEMSTDFNEVFERYAHIVKPEGGGKKLFAFNTHRFFKSMCRVWANLYGTVATFREKVLRDKALLKQEVKKLSNSEEGRVKKLVGELNVCRQRLLTVQDSLIE